MKTRLYLNQPLNIGALLEITDEQRHYLANVLRKKIGDEIFVFNEKFGEYCGVVKEVTKKLVLLELIEHTCLISEEEVLKIHLAFSLCKSETSMTVVRQATELGVLSIMPIISEYSITHKFNHKRHLSQIIEATEQCERITPPILEEPMKMEKFLENLEQFDLVLWCNESEKEKGLPDSKNCNVLIIIGPEGGWSEKEKGLFLEMSKKDKKILSISLGKTILKVDTAVVAAISSLLS